MDIRDQTVLLLGGSGLVGYSVARRILEFNPKQLVLVALYKADVEKAAQQLGRCAGKVRIDTAWGDVFLPSDAAQVPRNQFLADPALRERVIGDLLGDLSEEVLRRSALFQLFERYRPGAVIDCINTATAFAYQDVFQSGRELLEAARSGTLSRELVEEHVLTLTMPQLIRHVQIISEAMRRFETKAYAKVGTSGTGGMGFNVPYTHSEERPSRTLLTKAAVAGAHSLLLFLVGRTPGAPATFEVKPTAAIAWREIAYGVIRRRGRPIQRFDCPEPLTLHSAFGDAAGGWEDTGSPLESVYIDMGENGQFARQEFEAVSTLGSMEFITPEEVADYVVMELQGRPTGRDVVAALDASTAGPTYRAAIRRASAIERLKELEKKHGNSIAFEMLGPPRLSKHLFEAHIWSRIRDSVQALAESDPAGLSRDAVDLLTDNSDLRSTIISVGLPIIVPGGKVYRAETVIVPPADGDVEAAAPRGWVDLRIDNCRTWVERARQAVEQATARRSLGTGTGSDVDWDAIEPTDEIEPSRFATWIFKYEDNGERIKR